jgi:hypothetical protein
MSTVHRARGLPNHWPIRQTAPLGTPATVWGTLVSRAIGYYPTSAVARSISARGGAQGHCLRGLPDFPPLAMQVPAVRAGGRMRVHLGDLTLFEDRDWPPAGRALSARKPATMPVAASQPSGEPVVEQIEVEGVATPRCRSPARCSAMGVTQRGRRWRLQRRRPALGRQLGERAVLPAAGATVLQRRVRHGGRPAAGDESSGLTARDVTGPLHFLGAGLVRVLRTTESGSSTSRS